MKFDSRTRSSLPFGVFVSAILPLLMPGSLRADELGTHGFAQSGDVKIHYVTKGEGPLLVMIHGFPDFWYSWREQIPQLSKTFKVVAIDQRGYNKSDQPQGVEAYAMPKLVGDVVAVVRHFKRDKAVILGHDWGGAVAWQVAIQHPELTSHLVILNLPHLKGLQRELAKNGAQAEASEYARRFQQPNAAQGLNAELLSLWVRDPEARSRYVEAFRRSSFEGMLNYYKANYPRAPYAAPEGEGPRVQCPVLMIHGLKYRYLLAPALNYT